MEVVGTLIDGFGIRLQHTLPRMRCWTMNRRPRNGVQIISDIEANIRAGKVGYLHRYISIYVMKLLTTFYLLCLIHKHWCV